ncbi:MAG: hypothetical protein U1F54_23525 [Burkholderiales bacterium]
MNRRSTIALAAVLLALPVSPLLAEETRIKGADIMKHPIGPLAVQYVELVQAGRMEDALKLAYGKAQAEWKKYPGERASYTNFMKKMMPSKSDLDASLKSSAILIVDGNKGTLNVIKMEQQSGSPGSVTGTSTTVGIPFVMEGGKWKVAA